MKLFLLPTICCLISLSSYSQEKPIEILLLGSDHLTQVYKENYPNTDAFTSENQQELKDFSSAFEKFNPDMIMVENLPEEKPVTDSLYSLYRAGKLNFEELDHGRSEVYQIAFKIADNADLNEIICVDSKGGTSQSILSNGQNIEIYKAAGQKLGALAGEKNAALKQGQISMKEYLTFLNQPEAYNTVYNVRYIAPARVTNGTFKNPDEMVPIEYIDPDYIGAELISVFKNRDYKIYSNIVTNALEKKPERILLVIGVAHMGSLKNILRDDPEFKLVDATKFLNL